MRVYFCVCVGVSGGCSFQLEHIYQLFNYCFYFPSFFLGFSFAFLLIIVTIRFKNLFKFFLLDLNFLTMQQFSLIYEFVNNLKWGFSEGAWQS